MSSSQPLQAKVAERARQESRVLELLERSNRLADAIHGALGYILVLLLVIIALRLPSVLVDLLEILRQVNQF